MLTINWWMNSEVSGTKEWAITLWCWALSMLLLLLRASYSPLFTVVLANSFVVIGSIYMLFGISQYHQEKRLSKKIGALITVLMVIGIYYFALLEPSYKHRFLLLITFSAIAKFTALYFLLPTIRKFTAIGTVMAIGFLLHGSFFTYSAINLWLIPETLVPLQIAKTTELLLIEVFLFMLWFTVSTSMLTNILLQRDLKRLAFRDPLTGLFNRRSLFTKCEDLWSSSEDFLFSVLVIDVDYFKRINDTYGHDAGDKALQHIVTLITKELRETDIFGRTGGEEFLVALANTDQKQVSIVANRICGSVESNSCSYKEHHLDMTVSIGCATAEVSESSDFRALMIAADRAMYRAKKAGRNRVFTQDAFDQFQERLARPESDYA